METVGVALLQHTEHRFGSAKLRRVRRYAFLAACLLLVACNSDAGGSNPRKGPDPLLDGGTKAYDAFIAKQRGRPVVVNKWASWCGPCRVEFPYFRAVAKRDEDVTFIGVNSQDNYDDAREFLTEEPVPYKHFKDPNLEIAAKFNGVQSFPATAFYDKRGELAYLHQGPYRSEADLAEDIDRYAR